jgi:iron complex outermembrane receptor protein
MRVFANAEIRPLNKLIFNLGGMYEDEDKNSAVFSPRVAANYLVAPQHSLRLVYSTAVRSPDLLEQEPDYSLQITDLTENYLGLSEGSLYASQTGAYGDLDHERITSWELGYYGRIPAQSLEMDIKVYRDHLYQLISAPINLFTPDVNSDTEMNLSGVDWQFTWSPVRAHSFWYSGAYVDADVRLGDVSRLSAREVENLYRVETRLSSEFSHNLSWSFAYNNWRLTQSYFWHRSYDSGKKDGLNPYRRYEVHLQKDWKFTSFELQTSAFLHHLIDDEPIAYNTNRIEDEYLGYLQVGVKF